MKYTQPLNEEENAHYVNGDPSIGQTGSIIPAGALENPQREIVNAITDAGLTPSASSNSQLAQAISAKITAASNTLQALINGKQATVTGAATTITGSNLTASRALVSSSSGKVAVSAVTATELGYLSGVTSAIQTQINGKQATVTGAATTITGSNLTASRALVSSSSGKVAVSAVTATELGYLDGVTSAIQTQINGTVKTSGNETISGYKTFSNITLMNGIRQYSNDVTKGTVPSSTQYINMYMTDSSQASGDANAMGLFRTIINPNNTVYSQLQAFKNEAGSQAMGYLRVIYDTTDNTYFASVGGSSEGTNLSVTIETNSTNINTIPTMGWVNNPATSTNVVHRSGDETIAGTKTFTSDLYIKNGAAQLYMDDTQQTKGTAPSNNVWSAVVFHDANGNLMGRCRQLYAADKSNEVELQVHKANSSSDTDFSTMGIKYPASGNPYGFAPASDVNGSIVTTINKSKADNGYYELGNGLIIQWGSKAINGNTSATVTLPKAFTSTNYKIAVSRNTDANATGDLKAAYVRGSKTTTGFELFSGSGNQETLWIAIGY